MPKGQLSGTEPDAEFESPDTAQDAGRPGTHGGGGAAGGVGGVGGVGGGDPDETADLLDQLAAERDEARDKYTRSLADFQNYQRRALLNEREARQQGVTAVLTSIVPVLDHFDMALGHDTANAAAAQVIEGVKVIRFELLRALQTHGVAVISPDPNDEFDPNRHQAIMHQPAEGAVPGHISMTLQAGYALGDRVIRPAKVAVAPNEPRA